MNRSQTIKDLADLIQRLQDIDQRKVIIEALKRISDSDLLTLSQFVLDSKLAR